MNATVLGSKQPSEAYHISFDFTAWLGSETISSAVVVATDLADGSVVTSTVTTVGSQVIASPLVYVWVKAGTSGHDYNINCVVTCSAGSVYELDAVLPVEDEPGTPTVEPITLTEAKLHLRLATTVTLAEAYTTEDDLLEALIQAAREQAEAYTGRSLVVQNRTYYPGTWPSGESMPLPYPPLQSVTGVYYMVDGDTVETTMSSDDYDVDTRSEPGAVVLKTSESWPTDTLRPMSPIRVAYVAGYGVAADIPASIRAAIKMILTDLYEHRGEVVLGVSVGRIDRAIKALLDPYRMWSHL